MAKGVESGTRDLYEVLEVSPSASEADIRVAFRRLAAKYHPDRSSSPHTAIHFKRVNAAYQVLGDAERRAAYDSLTGQVEPAPTASNDPREITAPLAPLPAVDGWYLNRNGVAEGPVPPQVVVNWIANGLRDGMLRFGIGGEWHHVTQSVFAKFLPQTMPPPSMASDPELPPPRLLYVSDSDVGKKGGSVALKIIVVLLVALLIAAGVFFALPYLRRPRR